MEETNLYASIAELKRFIMNQLTLQRYAQGYAPHNAPGMQALRHPNAVGLRPMKDHAKYHDLSTASQEKLLLLWYLSRIAGNPVGYEAHGVLSFDFGDGHELTSQLRLRGYVLSETPLDLAIRQLTVPKLKDELKSHGLPVTGKRADLVARLLPALTPQDEDRLRSEHSIWCPSALGYELLYSYYVLWEEREWKLICAVADCNVPGIVEAAVSLQRLYPQRNGMNISADYVSQVLTTFGRLPRDQTDLMALFELIAGFRPYFEFHQVDWSLRREELR